MRLELHWRLFLASCKVHFTASQDVLLQVMLKHMIEKLRPIPKVPICNTNEEACTQKEGDQWAHLISL